MPVVVHEKAHQWLLDNPEEEITVDVEAFEVRLANGTVVDFVIEPFARHCILHGIDQMGYLEQSLGKIEAFEKNRSWQP